MTESGVTVGGCQAVTREEALRVMTRQAARFSFDESDRGDIEPGKLGDFVALDADLVSVPAERHRRIRPDATVIGERVAFERVARD